MMKQIFVALFVLLSCVKDGNAGITSTFLRSEWPSVDIPLDHPVFAIPKGYNAPQQVCLKPTMLPLLITVRGVRRFDFVWFWPTCQLNRTN